MGKKEVIIIGSGSTMLALLAVAMLLSPGPILSEQDAVVEIKKRGGNLAYDPAGCVKFVWLTRKPHPDEELKALRPFLRALPRLQRLSLYGTKVTGAGLRQLNGLENIYDLCLEHTEINDQDLVQLINLPNLQGLSLKCTKITDAGLKGLRRFRGLCWLELHGPAFTDGAFPNLAGLSSLRYLGVTWTSVSDAGLDSFPDLPSLQTLGLWDNTRLTWPAVEKLQRRFPKLKVEYTEPL